MAGFDVVIPAGGSIPDEFSRVVGVKSKPLIVFEEKTVLRRTLEALRGCSQVGRIVVVGSPDVVAHDDSKLADYVLPEVGSAPKNIWAGAQHLQALNFPPDRVIVVTGDLPFLKSETIDNFLGLCDQAIDFNVALVAKDDFDEAFPGATGTFVRLLDGEWTTGCGYLLTMRGMKIAMEHMEKVFQRRKSKFAMARLLGPKFLWDYMNKKLTVSDVEQKVMDILRVRGRAVPGSPPELAFDVDHLDDYHYALSSFKREAAKTAGATPPG